MGPVLRPSWRAVRPSNPAARALLAAGLLVCGLSAAQTPDFSFGDGRHGSFTVPPGETTIQDIWSQVRTGTDETAYDPDSGEQVPNLENLTISTGGTLTVTGYTGNAGGAVDPTQGGVLRLKVRGTLTIENGAAIDVSGKGYRGGTLEGAPPGRIGQQGDSWGNGGGISGDANRGGGGGGFGEVNGNNEPGSGGGGGHREAGARGATGMGSQTGGLGGHAFDTVATTLGQGFRDTFPFPRFGSGGGRGGQVENFSNTAAFGGNGGGVIIIEARNIVNDGVILADGGAGGSDLSGGGGGAGGSVLIQTLSPMTGIVSVEGGAGGVGTVIGNDGGAGGAGILLWDTRFELTTAVEGEGTISLSPPGGRYDANAVVEVTAEPAEGWQFDRWEGDLSGSTNPESLEMTSDRAITAVFVERPGLTVTPLVRDVGPSGGNISFNVTVSGNTGAVDWTAVVETGSDFITINTGSSGTNDDVITVTVARNMLDAARSGTIVVSSDDVSSEPVTVTINQGPATPVLSVTPTDVTADAEGDEVVIQVRNTGTGTFDWTATLLTGHAFATISSGGTGTNDGTFVVSLTENLSAQQRTATISVSAPGALNAPAEIRITQQAGVPLLQVTPSTQLIGSAAGVASVMVTNGGNGTMNWTAAVVDGASYASITEGSSGSNAGLISVTFLANTTMANRTARVRVESVDAANSPVEVTITQTSQEAVLLVSPETQTVGSGAGTASYQVQNTGTGTMNWTAAVLTGADFVTITSGVSGTDDGTITVNVDENTGVEDRTATIGVSAPGAANSPQTVTLVQTSRRPVLRILPAEQSVGSGGGAVNVTVENGGTGNLSWTASIAEGAEFLSISSPSSGINDGTVQVIVAPNADGENRIGTVRIEAPGAVESPQLATIIQLGCAVLDRPENLAASDGTFSDVVELIWSSVPNAMEYEVFRSPIDAPDRRELIGTSTVPRFTDTLAEPPDYELVNHGCFNPGEFIITNVIYYYEVKAINACGASDFSARTTGYRGLPSRDGDGNGGGNGNGGGGNGGGDGGEAALFVEDVLPVAKNGDGQVLGDGSGKVAFRFYTETGVDPASIWAQVNGAAVAPADLAWHPTADGGAFDGWVVVSGLGSEIATVDVGALTYAGESVATSETVIPAAAAKAGDEPVQAMPYRLLEETQGQFKAGLGDVFTIQPSTVFVEPVRIQIPVPHNGAGAGLTLYYYGEDAAGGHWYPADQVAGWLAAPVTRSDDGAYLEAWVYHGGIVRAGRLPGQAVPAAASAVPMNAGSLLLLVLTGGVFALAGRRTLRRHSR